MATIDRGATTRPQSCHLKKLSQGVVDMSHRASSANSVRLVRLARQLAARVFGSDKHQTGISAIRSVSAGLFYKRAERVQLMSQQTPIDSIGLNRDSSSTLYEWLVGKVSLAEAVVAAAEGKYEEAEAQFEESIQIFRRYHVPFEEAEALHYQGRALSASGELAQANEKLDAAIEIYRRCGAGERWVERVEADQPPRIAPLRSRTEKGEDAAGVRNEAVFWREGDYWTVTYKGETWRLKGAEGVHYIAYLLGHPREEFRALDMPAGIAGEGAETARCA